MRVPLQDLTVGMHVAIPLAWHEHPFIKNTFVISSENELQKIRKLGLTALEVDLSKSRLAKPYTPGTMPLMPPPPPPEPETPMIPEDLVPHIRDKNLPPEKKARIVMERSVDMMKGFLDRPMTSDNIKEVKEVFNEVVDLIMRDDQTTYYLANISDTDYNTYTHSVNVGMLGVALAKTLFSNNQKHDFHALGSGFFLHDLGKVKIDPAVISKAGKLTDDESKEMRRHPALGYQILFETKQLTNEAKLIVLEHHEWHNGKGYPRGIRGEDISLYGRLCSMVDVYDALTAVRPYKKKMASFEALKLMREEMIDHFQLDLFQQFVKMFKAP